MVLIWMYLHASMRDAARSPESSLILACILRAAAPPNVIVRGSSFYCRVVIVSKRLRFLLGRFCNSKSAAKQRLTPLTEVRAHPRSPIAFVVCCSPLTAYSRRLSD